MATQETSLEALQGLIGKQAGLSGWVEVTQEIIDGFADVTRDHQFIHVDRERAAASPFGGTIAHGLLVLSLLPHLTEPTLANPSFAKMGVNYGFEKVRFVAPVHSGAKIRGRFVVASLEERNPGEWRLVVEATVEIEGQDKPALVAEWVTLFYV